MFTSCGIQWLAQAAMYFSQAHLYLNGTSWLTSALELMICLSSTLMRRNASPEAIPPSAADGAAGNEAAVGRHAQSGERRPLALFFEIQHYWHASQSGLSMAQNLGSSVVDA